MSKAEPDLSALPQYVQERWPVAVERATSKTASAVPKQDANKLLKVSQKASTAAQRIVWLQRRHLRGPSPSKRWRPAGADARIVATSP